MHGWLRTVLCIATGVLAAPLAAQVPAPGPAFLQMVAVGPEAGAPAPFDTRWSIFLDGYIDDEAALRLARFADRRDVSGAIVFLNSSEGRMKPAMALGRLLRARGFETRVGARGAGSGRVLPGVCYSACAFAFAGGVQRSLDAGSVLGVRRMDPGPQALEETARERRERFEPLNYLAEMGIDAGLLELMETVPYGTIRPLSAEEIRRFGLLP